MTYSTIRPRRLRYNASLRLMLQQAKLAVEDLIMPIFVKHGNNIKNPIDSMPGQFQFSIDQLEPEIDEIVALGIKAVILFGIPENKDPHGSDALSSQGIIARAIQTIKQIAPELLIIVDVCMCEYTDHGHCGIVKEQEVDNDQTLPMIAQQALNFAQAGADIIAPSGMMDNAVKAIRTILDQNKYTHLPILSYAIKYASAFYGPFRIAAEGAPQFGDRRTYQADYANSEEAVKEVELDIMQGTDLVMVKPAHTYLDIIAKIKQHFPTTPLVAYHTSGEYALIEAATERGWVEKKQAVLEVSTAIKRAGADLIITYYAKYLARLLCS